MKKALSLIALLFLLVILLGYSKQGISHETEQPKPESSESHSLAPIKAQMITPTASSDNSGKQEFSNLLQSTLNEIAASSQPRQGDDPHEHPAVLSDLIEPLGDIAEQLHRNASYIPEGMKFYRSCAESETAITAARGLCLRNWLDWNKRTGGKETFSTDSLPFEVRHAANSLPKMD